MLAIFYLMMIDMTYRGYMDIRKNAFSNRINKACIMSTRFEF